MKNTLDQFTVTILNLNKFIDVGVSVQNETGEPLGNIYNIIGESFEKALEENGMLIGSHYIKSRIIYEIPYYLELTDIWEFFPEHEKLKGDKGYCIISFNELRIKLDESNRVYYYPNVRITGTVACYSTNPTKLMKEKYSL